MFENLNDSNFLLYAAKYYENSNSDSIEEFNEDLGRFKYIRRLFNRYCETGELKERLILNHIIILYNVFGEGATRMLFLKLKNNYELLTPFLLLLNRLPEMIVGIDGQNINTSDINLEPYIVSLLRKI